MANSAAPDEIQSGGHSGSAVLSEPSVMPSPVRYRPEIDGLRAVAVLAVFIFHFKREWLPGGFVGVDIFFVISGYLITSILIREREHGHFSMVRFYQRRIARLFPAFFTVALATIAGCYLVYSAQDLASAGTGLAAAVLSAENVRVMVQGTYFALPPDSQPFLHYWSLSVEEQFYLFFPSLFLLLYWKAGRRRAAVLAVLFGLSFAACIAVTRIRQEWAFYLLPTRAWELLAGGILAETAEVRRAWNSKVVSWVPAAGLALICVSFFAIDEHSAFPGFVALLPVLGAAFVIAPEVGVFGLAGRVLASSPMTFIGRMSYSLYLWHWPIFSLVDYRFYAESGLLRSLLKVGLSAAASLACYYFIEAPGRIHLNRPANRRIAFAFLCCALVVFIPLGLATRNQYHVNTESRDVAKGGRSFNENARHGSMVLMGDSNANMYGVTVRDLAKELDLKLNVLGVIYFTLPFASGNQPQPALWRDSLAFVSQDRPDFVMMVCNWQMKMGEDKAKLGFALQELERYAKHIILVTEPPEMPEWAGREAIRDGKRPPFREEPARRASRLRANSLVESFRSDKVDVINVESLFLASDGTIPFVNSRGEQLYHNNNHLAVPGANLVKPLLADAIRAHIH